MDKFGKKLRKADISDKAQASCTQPQLNCPMRESAGTGDKTKSHDGRNEQVNNNSLHSKETCSRRMSSSKRPPSSAWTVGTAATPVPHIGLISLEDHVFALNQLSKLMQDLDDRIRDAESASKVCRDLAAWTYNERNRLIRDMEAAKSEASGRRKQVVENECGALSVATCRFLESEINKARTEAGLTPLNKEEMSVRIYEAKVAFDQNTGLEAAQLCDRSNIPAEAPSISDQVDELIAQEIGNLSSMDEVAT